MLTCQCSSENLGTEGKHGGEAVNGTLSSRLDCSAAFRTKNWWFRKACTTAWLSIDMKISKVGGKENKEVGLRR